MTPADILLLILLLAALGLVAVSIVRPELLGPAGPMLRAARAPLLALGGVLVGLAAAVLLRRPHGARDGSEQPPPPEPTPDPSAEARTRLEVDHATTDATLAAIQTPDAAKDAHEAARDRWRS